MVEQLSGMFNTVSGGNVYNVILHINAATLRGLKSFILSYLNVKQLFYNSISICFSIIHIKKYVLKIL